MALAVLALHSTKHSKEQAVSLTAITSRTQPPKSIRKTSMWQTLAYLSKMASLSAQGVRLSNTTRMLTWRWLWHSGLKTFQLESDRELNQVATRHNFPHCNNLPKVTLQTTTPMQGKWTQLPTLKEEDMRAWCCLLTHILMFSHALISHEETNTLSMFLHHKPTQWVECHRLLHLTC